ncbi:hypothetical protein IAD21_00476 [Abditibacteriota bacterium]|nr:hypothetical protein IAD21_00476 [Abditibacteriota bacterium]
MAIYAISNMYAFGQGLLVACPQCSKRAALTTHADAPEPHIILTCSNCDFTQQWQQPHNEIRLQNGLRWVGRDNYPKAFISAPAGYGSSTVCIWVGTALGTFGKSEGLSLRLWLQSPCDGENLWFLNREHLTFVENYVKAGPRTRSLLWAARSRWLQEWVQQTENKESILGCIQDMRLM